MYEIKMMEEIYQKKQEELGKLFSIDEIAKALKNKNDQNEYQKAIGCSFKF